MIILREIERRGLPQGRHLLFRYRIERAAVDASPARFHLDEKEKPFPKRYDVDLAIPAVTEIAFKDIKALRDKKADSIALPGFSEIQFIV